MTPDELKQLLVACDESARAYPHGTIAKLGEAIRELEAKNRTITNAAIIEQEKREIAEARYLCLRDRAKEKGQGGGEALWEFWLPVAATFDDAVDLVKGKHDKR
jgi:hypothetical protein